MGSRSQRKGAAGERELFTILQEHGYACTRGSSLTFWKVPDITGLPGMLRNSRMGYRFYSTAATVRIGFVTG